jgi:hypothetical protein
MYLDKKNMTRNRAILINAANLHTGGGIQVAVSFIYEIDRLNEYSFDVIVSSIVHNELISLGVCVNSFNSYTIFDARGGLVLFNLKFQRLLLNYDVVFTIFGPLYSWKKPKNSVIGFAQPWIVYPHNEIYCNYNYFDKTKAVTKYFLQWIFYRNSDKLIVELDHVMERLHKLKNGLAIKYIWRQERLK